MRNKRENLKKTLGISEYPWSSDDDDPETQDVNELHSTQQHNVPEGRPSVADNPGTSGQQINGTSQTSTQTPAETGRHLFWSLPSTSTRRAPTLTLRRNREEMPLSLVSRVAVSRGPPGAAGILSFRKMNRTNTRTHLPHRHTPRAHQVTVDTSREGRHQSHMSPALSSAMSLRRAQLNASLEYVNNELRMRADLLRDLDQCDMSQAGARRPILPPPHDGIDGLIEPRASDPMSGMQPINLSDDGFLEPDLQLNLNSLPAADERMDISITEPPVEDGANEPADGSSEAQGSAGAGHASALSLEEVVEIDAEPEPAHRAQEPTANTSSASDAATTVQPQGVKRKRECDDDDINDLGTVKDFNLNLLRLLECPVCLEWMEPPMWQCRRGHLVCGRCRARLQACPVCRTAFSSVRNRAMEGVAEMLRYPCRHGCGRDLQLRRRAVHEASCAARRYRCPAPVCASRPPLAHRDLAQHFQSKHLPMVKVGGSHSFSMRVNSEQHDNWILLALGQLFHLRVDVDIQTWGVVVYVAYIGPKCNADDYTYEVTVTGQHNSRKLVYTRSTHCDLECSSLNVSRQDCFHLTLDQALNFLRVRNRHAEPDKYLHFSVHITGHPATALDDSN